MQCEPPPMSNEPVKEFNLNCLDNLGFYECTPYNDKPIKLDSTVYKRRIVLDMEPDYKEMIGKKEYYSDQLRANWERMLKPTLNEYVNECNLDIYRQCTCKLVKSVNCSTKMCKFNDYDCNSERFKDGLEFMDILSDNLKSKLKEN